MKQTILLISIFFTACKSQQVNPISQKNSANIYAESFQGGKNCKPIISLEKVKDSVLYTRTNILNFEINNGCLCAEFQYNGCGEANAQLIYLVGPKTGKLPEVYGNIMVKGAGECEALIVDSACFSLEKLRTVSKDVVFYLNEEVNNTLISFQN